MRLMRAPLKKGRRVFHGAGRDRLSWLERLPPRRRTWAVRHDRDLGGRGRSTPPVKAVLSLRGAVTHSPRWARIRTQIVPRAALRKGMYVIVTCQRVGGTLQAVTVHIEYRHPRGGAA